MIVIKQDKKKKIVMVPKEIEVDVYIAEDGTEFEDEIEAVAYEQTRELSIQTQINIPSMGWWYYFENAKQTTAVKNGLCGNRETYCNENLENLVYPNWYFVSIEDLGYENAVNITFSSLKDFSKQVIGNLERFNVAFGMELPFAVDKVKFITEELHDYDCVLYIGDNKELKFKYGQVLVADNEKDEYYVELNYDHYTVKRNELMKWDY